MLNSNEQFNTEAKQPSFNSELFCFCSHKPAGDPESLGDLIRESNINPASWGVGFYRGKEAYTERVSGRPPEGSSQSEIFQRILGVLSSQVIIGHVDDIPFENRGDMDAQPYLLRFLLSKWLFAGVGVATGIEKYQTPGFRLRNVLEQQGRTFEFIRDNILEYLRDPHHCLSDALVEANRQLFIKYPDSRLAYILTNGFIICCFSNFKNFYISHRDRESYDAVLISTIQDTRPHHPWLCYTPKEENHGKLLLLASSYLMCNLDIPLGEKSE